MSCGDGSLKLWSPSTPAKPVVGILAGHKGDVNSVECGHISKVKQILNLSNTV